MDQACMCQKWQDMEVSAFNMAAAIGNFDGVHLGHAHVIRMLRNARPGSPLSVITFTPHPRMFFRPQDPPFLLTTASERRQALQNLGVKHVFEIPFTRAFSSLSAHEFVHQVLYGKLKISHLACGEDFAFGHRREGDVSFLERELVSLGVGLSVVPIFKDKNGPLSSSRIRRLLQDGYPERAAEELGRFWSISGVVAHGDKRGRQLGFPTANIALGSHIEPARGVYAVRVVLEGGRVEYGVANIGRRPTINDGQESRLEVNVFDFSGDLYGQTLQVFLHHMIREERRFSSLEELKDNITRDAEAARAYWA
ncbi:bifunctional riboflavin kinase/FAD synthetase [Entomobacter blattae]|uniref:Riboflavin biosynthesis protein n=1 Tax=Entomobacter blattae TaxID=2762277 RepID=A0A7H1NUQ8_9PROT|nr:bifunctional riboflavin kinase/FAD synthetase [Entomobacter blattae]QNT79518.1 Riboflavin biosynthesis protein RibF [Entomobacter blattae]